jgi:hypothetical protein
MKDLQDSVKRGVQQGIGQGLLEKQGTGHVGSKPACVRSLRAAAQNCIMLRRTKLMWFLHTK